MGLKWLRSLSWPTASRWRSRCPAEGRWPEGLLRELSLSSLVTVWFLQQPFLLIFFFFFSQPREKNLFASGELGCCYTKDFESLCPRLLLWGVWRCWCRLGFSLAANRSVLQEPKPAWNAGAGLMCSSKCISLYLNIEWDVIVLGVVNHFRLAPFKARLWSSRFIGSTNPFKPVSFQPYRSRNKVHQLDLARNAPSPVHGTSWPVAACSTHVAGYSQSLFFPKALNSHSPCSCERWEPPCPPQPVSCHPRLSVPDAVTTTWVAAASRTRELI